jgi:hypothetical protein
MGKLSRFRKNPNRIESNRKNEGKFPFGKRLLGIHVHPNFRRKSFSFFFWKLYGTTLEPCWKLPSTGKMSSRSLTRNWIKWRIFSVVHRQTDKEFIYEDLYAFTFRLLNGNGGSTNTTRTPQNIPIMKESSNLSKIVASP